MRGGLRPAAGPLLLALLLTSPAAGADTAALLARLKAVGKEGAGNAEAGKAWKELVQAGPEELPAILAALDDADATAANWLRAAVDAVAERALAAGRPLPKEQLEKFVRDTRHAGPARRGGCRGRTSPAALSAAAGRRRGRARRRRPRRRAASWPPSRRRRPAPPGSRAALPARPAPAPSTPCRPRRCRPPPCRRP